MASTKKKKSQRMYKFSKESIIQLATCDTRLQLVAQEALKIIDFTVLEGFRPSDKQDDLFKKGKSQKRGGDSKHNQYPSFAFDIAPYPIDFNYVPSFYYLAGIIMATAHRHGIRLRWGGDWDSDNNLKEENFRDLGHFELVDMQ